MTTIQLALANNEVKQLFTRTLKENKLFYEAVVEKIAALERRCRSDQVYALLRLHHIQNQIHELTNQYYDDIDRFEGILEKKSQLQGTAFQFELRYHTHLRFESCIAADLVELFKTYDRLLSFLKVLRTARCFTAQENYFLYLRRYFKSINRLLSHIYLTSLQSIPTIPLEEAIANSAYEQDKSLNWSLLIQLIEANSLLDFDEKKQRQLLNQLKPMISSDSVLKEAI